MDNFIIYFGLTGYEIGWSDSMNTSSSENALRLFCVSVCVCVCVEDDFGISPKRFTHSGLRGCSSLCLRFQKVPFSFERKTSELPLQCNFCLIISNPVRFSWAG